MKVDPYESFRSQMIENIARLAADKDVQGLSRVWTRETNRNRYTYNFSWLGRPIIQYPQDIVAMQEIIWQVRPDLIIETGIAHGGSLVFSASMLALLDMIDATSAGGAPASEAARRMVLGIDIDIRAHNRAAIEAHPMSSRIQMIQGSSIDPNVVAQVRSIASHFSTVLVSLDSMHTYDHVLAELEAYAPLVSAGSYCVVFDTLIEDMPAEMFNDRPWRPGNSPKTAVREYLETHSEFEIDQNIPHKLLITVAPDGYLRRIR